MQLVELGAIPEEDHDSGITVEATLPASHDFVPSQHSISDGDMPALMLLPTPVGCGNRKRSHSENDLWLYNTKNRHSEKTDKKTLKMLKNIMNSSCLFCWKKLIDCVLWKNDELFNGIILRYYNNNNYYYYVIICWFAHGLFDYYYVCLLFYHMCARDYICVCILSRR